MSPSRDQMVLGLTLGVVLLAGCQARLAPASPAGPPLPDRAARLVADLDAIFDTPALGGGLIGVSVVALSDGQTVYERLPATRLIPASTMKIVTAAVAADRLGWHYRFETRLERSGPIRDGVLEGDLFVRGGGDPSIDARNLDTAPLFERWAVALRAAGIDRIDGRLIGDDDAFDDAVLGAGWAWDYLAAGYAAPSGAISYNENVAVVRIEPGAEVGDPAAVAVGPPGHGLEPDSRVTTGLPSSPSSVVLRRLPGSRLLTIDGSLPAGSGPVIRTASVDNPTRYFLDALARVLARHGITIGGGVHDIDDLADRPAPDRDVIAVHQSPPLSSLIGYMLKVSQNFYGDMLLRQLGVGPDRPGSSAAGRKVVVDTLETWGVDPDTLVMYDGSGLSRYNYASPALLTSTLVHAWRDERLRGPFTAALPVGGRDGTLAARMQEPPLDRRVQAKTGTISNVRALAGYLMTEAGDRLAFAMLANNFVAPTAQVDAVMEDALRLLARDGSTTPY